LHLVRHCTTLTNRTHAALVAFGHPCRSPICSATPVRELLDRLQIPDPWRANIDVSLQLIDDLELQIAALTVQLKRQGVDHRYISPLVTAPGIGWINAFTIASEIGDIARFPSPAKLCGYTGLCPRVRQWRRRRARPALKARAQVPALGIVRGRVERLQAPLLRRALTAHQAPSRPPARPQGRPDRSLPPAHRGDLAHAHPQPAIRSGRRPSRLAGQTAHFGHAPPDDPLRFSHPRTDGAIET
jgi:transposase